MNTVAEKNKDLNPWSEFALQNIFKDIDEQFMQSFEAIDFLVQIKEKDFSQKFDLTLRLGSNKPTSLNSTRYNSEEFKDYDVKIEDGYNFNDFLIYKLIENFRRIYAIENKSKKPKDKKLTLNISGLIDESINPITPNRKKTDLNKKEITSLLDQQQNIYSIVDKTVSYLDYQKNDLVYPRAIVGKNYSCSSLEILCYLGIHQSLQKENIPLHKKWFTSCMNTFTTNEINHKHLNLFKKVFSDHNKRFFINNYVKKLNINEVFSNLAYYDSVHEKYIISLIDIYSEENIYLKDEQKKNLLLKFFHIKPMRFLEDHETDSFEEKMNHLFKDFPLDTVIDKISVDVLNIPEGKWLLKNLKTSQCVPFLTHTIFNDDISNSIKSCVIAKFDLANQNLLKNIVDFTVNNYKKNTHVQISQTMTHFGSYMEKPLLAHIISKNTDFYDIIKPFYLKNKFNERLIEKNEEISARNNTKKI